MKKETRLPTMQELTDFLNKQSGEVNKRDIARHFKIKGDDRAYLKHLLSEIEHQGLIVRQGRSFTTKGHLPERVSVEITGIDSDGELVGRPVAWEEAGPMPQILISSKGKLKPPPGIGDVIIARVKPIHAHLYEGEALRRVTGAPNQMVGVFFDGKIVSVDRRFKEAFELDSSFPPLKPNDLVIVEIPELRKRRPVAHFIRQIGKSTDPHAASLISIFAHHLPIAFSVQGLKQAKAAKLPELGRRTDLRDVPFVTVDGADARDFDDAVFAESDVDPKNKGGWHIYVAIADVAYFVRFGTALDSDAFERGNSTYFPDRVLPMLPEALSNGLCSLNPGEDRPAMVAEIWIDKEGHQLKHRFLRAMIRSKARLTYDQVEADFNRENRIIGLESQMDGLKGAYETLLKARRRRGVLELDVPELQVVLNDKGQVTAIRERERFASHKMIEELMILANVAAAQTLEDLKLPTMYRVHDRPSPEKMEDLNAYLSAQGLTQHIKDHPAPDDFNRILKEADSSSKAPGIHEMVLRSQSQAEYSPENIGHFGLALDKYAHFTSPIRRYADVLIHRALIKGLKLGEGALADEETSAFSKIAEHISATERQSAAAEQDALDRYVASYLADRVGEKFTARISSVTAFGLFVRLDAYGADGLIPISSLPDDYYVFDDRLNQLKGRSTKRVFSIGQNVDVVLKEAVPLTSGLLFHVIQNGKKIKSNRGRKGTKRRH